MTRPAHRRRPGRRGRDRGTVAVEAAVVIPAALFFVMLLIQAGVYWHAYHVAHATADVALAAARADGATTEQAHTTDRKSVV